MLLKMCWRTGGTLQVYWIKSKTLLLWRVLLCLKYISANFYPDTLLVFSCAFGSTQLSRVLTLLHEFRLCGPFAYREDGSEGEQAALAASPVAEVGILPFLQDVLLALWVLLRVAHPPGRGRRRPSFRFDYKIHITPNTPLPGAKTIYIYIYINKVLSYSLHTAEKLL